MKETQTLKNKAQKDDASVRITGSEAIVKCLLEENVTTVYGYPGGAIMPSAKASPIFCLC